MNADINDGFTSDELLQIGTRKKGIDLNISATDINSPIPFSIGQYAQTKMDGFTEQQLKTVAERKMTAYPISPSEINTPRVTQEPMFERALFKLESILGIRIR